MAVYKTAFGDLEIPDLEAGTEELNRCYNGFGSILEKERFCLELQRQQPDFIEMNKRLMKAGKIIFDEYEEVK